MPLNLLVCNSMGKFRQSCVSEIVLGWYIEVRVEFACLQEFSSESCQAWTIASIWIPICFRASVSILGFGTNFKTRCHPCLAKTRISQTQRVSSGIENSLLEWYRNLCLELYVSSISVRRLPFKALDFLTEYAHFLMNVRHWQ